MTDLTPVEGKPGIFRYTGPSPDKYGRLYICGELAKLALADLEISTDRQAIEVVKKLLQFIVHHAEGG